MKEGEEAGRGSGTMLLGDGERNWGRNSLICKKTCVGRRRQCCEGRSERQEGGVVMRDKTGTRSRDVRKARHEGGPGNEKERRMGECDETWDWANAEIVDPPFARYDRAQGSARIMQRRGDEVWLH